MWCFKIQRPLYRAAFTPLAASPTVAERCNVWKWKLVMTLKELGGQGEGGVKLLKPWSKNTEGDAKECLDLSSSSILLCLTAGNPTKAPQNEKIHTTKNTTYFKMFGHHRR